MTVSSDSIVGIIGAGTMGAGIAQVAATAGNSVVLFDISEEVLAESKERLAKILNRLVEKGRIEEEKKEAILGGITFTSDFSKLAPATFLIEAVVEDLAVKQNVFEQLEALVSPDAVLASNTSSLSVASIAGSCRYPERVVGVHFFNPAPLMPLVELVPALQTNAEILSPIRSLLEEWDKVVVTAKDTPGFIVNRVARPFYGEAIRIFEEGIADVATIDWAMKEVGGFRMGPFELMDLIGNDVNYAVTATVFQEFFFDPRFKPSFTQKRMVEAGLLGRKVGRGYYEYGESASHPEPNKDKTLADEIVGRIVAMLVNEATDALYLGIASAKDIDLAMTKGVNYPKGLLAWGEEIGLANVFNRLQALYEDYSEDRYRPHVLLRRLVRDGKESFSS